VHVHAGGQAVVGNVGHRRRRAVTKNGKRPHEHRREKSTSVTVSERSSV
jgi:hypothetical protein